MAGLAERNDLPLLFAGDLADGILEDAAGVAVPMPTLWVVVMVMAVDWEPVLKTMLSEVPAPEVLSSVSVEVLDT